MTRRRLIQTLAAVSLLALGVWIAGRVDWVDAVVPMPPKGEALTNPFYAVQRFAEELGAHTERDRAFDPPPVTSVIVLSNWKWRLTAGRRASLEQWVEAGGRLVADETVAFDRDFEKWSQIRFEFSETERTGTGNTGDCSRLQEEANGAPQGGPGTRYWLCGLDGESFLTSTRDVVWALRDATGPQAMRVAVGRGSVTVINASPWRQRALFDGDHGWVFVAATGLHRGDDVHFLSDDAHRSLLALIWQNGAPAVILTLAVVALLLWRGGVRLGPLTAPPDTARRSLAEQVTGSGQFALRHGGGDSLHAASVRALDEAGRRRVPAYARLSDDARADALARLTGSDRDALAAAVQRRPRNLNELRHALATIEATRRRTHSQ